MEILIVVMLMTVVVKRGVEDVWHTARGNTPPRYAAASARKKTGAAGKYWGALWDDTWSDMHQRHAEKRANPNQSRGAATVFWSNLWRDGWVAAERRRQGKATRPRPETVTVPGEVVPDFEDGPEDGPRPEPQVVPTEDGRTDLRFGDDPTDPTGVSSCPECRGTGLTEDGEICPSCRDRQEQRNQHWDQQEVRIKDCRNCDGYPNITFNSLRHEHDEFCLAPEILFPTDEDGRDAWQVTEPGAHKIGALLVADMTDQQFAYYAKYHISPVTPTQEGSTMTATTTEIAGLDSAITWCDESTQQYRAEITSAEATGAYCSQLAKSYRAQVVATEAVEAAITGAGVTGPALARLTAVKEKADAAAWAMERAEAEFATARELAETAAADCEAAAAEFRAFKPGQEFYDARPDAPGREFLTAGR